MQTATESVLRDNLFQLRKVIDMYAAEMGELPQTLDDLVQVGYLREVPVDPITGKKDWITVTGDDPNSTSGRRGIVDVRSASQNHSEW